MKKLLCILFCFVYLASSAGINVNLHFCGGKVKSISFFHSDEKDCCGKAMKKRDCCKEKTISYKVKEDQKASSHTLCAKAQTTLSTFALSTENLLLKKELFVSAHKAPDDPPERSSNPRFLVNRVFRI